jgi:glycosyltransferase involved in cell wall biosynthesis
MREVWSQTKVVLMPSEYESYGMVAAEACVNGIPVIAHPTKGLVECLDSAGLFIPRDDTDGYERTLRLLLTDPLFYAERSAISRLRGEELARQTDRELKRFVRRLRKLVRE